MKNLKNLISPVLILAAAMSVQAADRILLFTKTASTRENNIVQTRTMLKTFYEGKGLTVDTSENAALFSDTSLAKYKAVVFLKTTGTFLTTTQQTAFENYFKACHGAVLIHAALDAEPNWTFYGKIIGGAYFKSLGGDSNTTHRNVIEDTGDASTKLLPRPWTRKDEIYNFKADPRSSTDPVVHVLVTVDPSSYTGGSTIPDHPMSWYDTYMGGRAWVTAMGHTTPSYADPLFLGHLWGGLQYALGQTGTPLVYSGGKAGMKIKTKAVDGYQANGQKLQAHLKVPRHPYLLLPK